MIWQTGFNTADTLENALLNLQNLLLQKIPLIFVLLTVDLFIDRGNLVIKDCWVGLQMTSKLTFYV